MTSFYEDSLKQADLEIYSSLALQKFRREVFDFGLKKGICASCTIADYSHKAEDAKRKRFLVT